MKVYLKNYKSILMATICLTYTGLVFLPIKWSNLLVLILFSVCAVKFNFREVSKAFRENMFFKLSVAVFLLQVIGLLYTSNMKAGFFALEKKMYFILFPVFLLPLCRSLTAEDRSRLFRMIGIITVASSMILLIVGAYRKFVLHYPKAFFFASFRNFEGFTPIHYVYYSMFFAIGSFILLDSIIPSLRQKRYGIVLLALLYLYILLIVVLVASKMGIVVFTVATIVFLYYKIGVSRKFVRAVAMLLAIVLVFIYSNKTTRDRFIGLDDHLSIVTKEELQDDVSTQITGLNMRLLFWKITLTHGWEENVLLFGVGTGDTQDYIDSLYNLDIYQLYGYIGWDPHSQWVSALLQVGIPGVLLIAMLYGIYFRMGVKARDLKLLIFLIITLAFSFTESILELNKGIVYFTMFFTLFSSDPATRRAQLSH